MQTEQIALLKEIRDLLKQLVAQGKPQAAEAPTGGGGPGPDQKITKIVVKAISTAIGATSALQLVGIWHWDGTNAYLIDEIIVTAVVPSVTVASFKLETTYADLTLPATHALYASTTVTTTAATTALQVKAHGSSL